jgi:putative SOS response-associated peptidase YedK
MCGRYAISSPPETLAQFLDITGALPNFPAHYNCAPTQPLPVVRKSSRGGREFSFMQWGLVPTWSKGPDTRFSMINARAETVASKPAYRGPFRQHRCLIPADGFYEWQKTADGKQPHFFSSNNGEPLAMAGLWDEWMGPHGDEILSFSIITTKANTLVRPIHDRMPVILSSEHFSAWLGEDEPQSQKALEALLLPFPAAAMQSFPVSRRVNSPANDDADLVMPLAG